MLSVHNDPEFKTNGWIDRTEMQFLLVESILSGRHVMLYVALLNGRNEFAQALAKANEKVLTS